MIMHAVSIAYQGPAGPSAWLATCSCGKWSTTRRDEWAAFYAGENHKDDAYRRGEADHCACHSIEFMEYDPAGPCDYCKRQALTEIDVDGLDDKRETPGLVA